MISVCTAEHVSTQAQRLVRVRVRRETDWARCASLRKQGESPQIHVQGCRLGKWARSSCGGVPVPRPRELAGAGGGRVSLVEALRIFSISMRWLPKSV